jgi:SAM-dependent methyltransferase
MLTAFNYYEPEEENRIQKGMKESAFFIRELQIADDFLKQRQGIQRKKITICPVCGMGKCKSFYEKWGITYVRCDSCYSVVAEMDGEEAQAYQSCSELTEFRLSEAYQEDGLRQRSGRWEELFDWLQFRTFRYLGRNTDLAVLDYGTKWKGFIDMLQDSSFCKSYQLKDSIYSVEQQDDGKETYDIIMAVDYFQHVTQPEDFLEDVHHRLKEEGLFILNTKVGSGIDILALQGKNKNVFPPEHVMLPSKEGIRRLLERMGFQMLEFTTPGTFDVNFLKSHKDEIAEEDCFLSYFLETSTTGADADFQRFIQKHGLSSYAQVIAKKVRK